MKKFIASLTLLAIIGLSSFVLDEQPNGLKKGDVVVVFYLARACHLHHF